MKIFNRERNGFDDFVFLLATACISLIATVMALAVIGECYLEYKSGIEKINVIREKSIHKHR